jgi:hypothetical protein
LKEDLVEDTVYFLAIGRDGRGKHIALSLKEVPDSKSAAASKLYRRSR